jgi:hypothetical protein
MSELADSKIMIKEKLRVRAVNFGDSSIELDTYHSRDSNKINWITVRMQPLGGGDFIRKNFALDKEYELIIREIDDE